MTKNEIVPQLKECVATVTFTKVDGTLRIMKCTLKSDVLPEANTNAKSTRTVSENILPVWDIENNGWRSVRLDSIKSISFSPGV